MKKILLSLAILGVVGAMVVGGTTAIFSDTETSTGNTFTAGAIDLTVDNESYYNGVLNEGTSWLQTDLTEKNLFFDFRDLKPGDYGEDTISLHVKNNDSYLCADVTLTSNQDNGWTEPELNDEDSYTAGRGELGDRVSFIAWADDGDNVPEVGETVYSLGPIGGLNLGETETAPLADSQVNVWNDNLAGGPLPGDSTRYIGKAWCFGEMTPVVIPQDGFGKFETPEGSIEPNGPEVRGAGFTCSGAGEDNSTQTDSLTADISFRAIQARHNEGFECLPETVPTTAALTVDKKVSFSSTALAVVVGDFTLHVSGPNSYEQDFTDEISVAGLEPGPYTITEQYNGSENITYDATFSLDCIDKGSYGEVTLAAGGNLTCKIDNEITPGADN